VVPWATPAVAIEVLAVTPVPEIKVPTAIPEVSVVNVVPLIDPTKLSVFSSTKVSSVSREFTGA
jgi:hypothetical protein